MGIPAFAARSWIAVCVMLLLAPATMGQPPTSSKYESLLLQVLRANVKGECPESLMSPMLLDQCEQQMPALKQRFDQLGAVRGARFRGVQQSQFGPAEVYRVEFENGNMTWMINTGPDGKILTLFTPG